MLERTFYQPTIVFLTVIALVGGVAVLLASGGSPGIEIVPAEHSVTFVDVDSGAPGSSAAGNTHLLNINTATASQLDESLPGIGPTLSGRIVAYRQQNGPFERTDQLMQVNGIGETTYERLRHFVTVGN